MTELIPVNEGVSVLLLTAIIFVPALGALALIAFPKEAVGAVRNFSLLVTVVTFGLTVYLLGVYQPPVDASVAAPDDVAERFDLVRVEGGTYYEPQPSDRIRPSHVVHYDWIPSFHIAYFLGVDGISLPLVLLTGLLSMLAMMASTSITQNVKAYCILFLLLETGMLGVFLALDFFLFYVFWEVMLLPMYFLIGIWGGPRRDYAAIKFFLYTLLGSVLILIAMLMFYFGAEPNTFNLLTLHRMAAAGNGAEVFQPGVIQNIAFVLLFIGFAIKVPVFPFHTWLPDAHVEAPTPISMILAGVLLKMGGYGILRIAYPLCPAAAYAGAFFLALLGVWNILYGALAAMAQTDFKKLVAYSSISHMGYVILGIAVWNATADGQYWNMAMNGAMFQMVAHGLTSAGMFFLVGVVYDRVHHRDLDRFGGLFSRMPVYGGLSFGIFFAAMGLPGLCGFIGEVLVVLGTWPYSPVLAILAAAGVILTAGYILWTLQRVYLGAEYRGPYPEGLAHPMTGREVLTVVPLLVFAVLLGVYPESVFYFMRGSVELLVQGLASL